MRLGLYPFASTADIEENTEHILAGMRQAAGQSADLICFHECALCGYPPIESRMAEMDPAALTAAAERLCGAAKAYGIHAALGTVRFDRDRRYNSILYIDRGGKPTGIYDKQALWGWDAENFTFGTLPGIVEIAGLRVGFRICFDVRFPEPFRALYAQHTDLCVVAFSDSAEQSDPARYDQIRAHLMTRAVENVMTVASVNTLSRQQTAPNAVIDPSGRVVLEGKPGEEKLLVWDVQPAPDTFGSRGRRANSDRLMAAWKQK